MDAQQFLNDYQGQSLLYAPSPAREYLRGQCAQEACVYVADNGFPVLWVEAAADWYLSGLYPDRYDRFENTPAAVPQPGDIIVWDKALPGSGGYGHIAIVLSANINSFVSIDQNWGGKTVHTVNHTYAHVLGWLRMKRAVPAPTQPEGDEMITSEAQAHQAYKLLRPNGDGSPDEIAMTAGKRSWASFADGAQNELNQRDANLRDQQQKSADLQALITQLQQQLAALQQQDLGDQQATKNALAQAAQLTSQLNDVHTQIASLQSQLNPTLPTPDVKTENIFQLIASLLKIKPKV